VQPDIIVCRTEHPLNDAIKNKIALFCNVLPNAVIEAIDAQTIYDVPLLMREERLDLVVLEKMLMPTGNLSNLEIWENFIERLKNPESEVNIGLIGKYVELKDSYKSIIESFVHAGAALRTKVNLRLIHAETLNGNKPIEKSLFGLSGILVAPGFGERGFEGKIQAIQYARENKIPFFGICLGMQCAQLQGRQFN